MSLQNKKGMELAINFLVVIILSIAIFGMAITLLYKIVNQTEEIGTKTLKQLDEEIVTFTCKSSDQICFTSTRETIRRGEFSSLKVRVKNINDDATNFKLTIREKILPSGASGLKVLPQAGKEGARPTDGTPRKALLNRGQTKEFGFGFTVPDDAKSGTYVYNVYIDFCQTVVNLQNPAQSVTCTPGSLVFEPYQEDLYKVYIEVP